MARTAVDMPEDPLDDAGGGAAVGGADDLLAQLAGDEVDRLLSEAEAGPPDPRYAERSATGEELDEQLDAGAVARDVGGASEVEAARGDEGVSGDIEAGDDGRSAEKIIEERADELVERARREAVEAAAAVTPTVAASGPASAADALAAEMEADAAAHAAALRRMAAEPAGGAAKAAGGNQASFARPVSDPAVAEPETSAGAAVIDEPAVVDEAAVDGAVGADEDLYGREPLLVRVLAWMNSPLAGLSQGVREGLGKVALVTAVNAVAVLVYVLIFRKH